MSQSELNFIKERVAIKKEQLSREGLAAPEDRELIKEALEEEIEESLREYPAITDIHQSMPPSVPSSGAVLDDDNKDAENKVKELVNIALQDNISKAVILALKTGNAFLIDRLHDTLTDKYYQELKNKNAI